MNEPYSPLPPDTVGPGEPYAEEPRRFTPILIAAAIVGVVGAAAILLVLLSSGGGAPRTSATPAGSGIAVSGDPTASPGAGPTGPVPPGASAQAPSIPPSEFAAEACAEPTPTYETVRPTLLTTFRELCVDAVATVLQDELIDPATVRLVAWAYGTDGGPVSRVFLRRDGLRGIARYDVVDEPVTGEPTVAGGPEDAQRIGRDAVFRWARDEG